ncbi:MAG TPA: hypothetical protein VEK08_16020 [Planctomycetota bacterium]|nr:hypothetical protein [Planctomycetota bacterium]
MQIYYCEGCELRIDESEFSAESVVKHEEKVYCSRCAAAKGLKKSSSKSSRVNIPAYKKSASGRFPALAASPVTAASVDARTAPHIKRRWKSKETLSVGLIISAVAMALFVVNLISMSNRAEPDTKTSPAAAVNGAGSPAKPAGQPSSSAAGAERLPPGTSAPVEPASKVPPATKDPGTLIQNELAQKNLDAAKAWWKENPHDPWGYKEKLNTIASAYRTAPAGEEAARIISELAIKGEPEDSPLWHRFWKIGGPDGKLGSHGRSIMHATLDGREAVLETHPPALKQPLLIERTIKVPQSRPYLEFSVRAHANRGVKIEVEISGQKVHEEEVNGHTWLRRSLDVSAFKGKEVHVLIKHWPTGWNEEYAYWTSPRLVSKPSNAAISGPNVK